MTGVLGIHHVTAIASDPQRNLDFYVGLLGLRLVKRTVNFDDPETYHLYFADLVAEVEMVGLRIVEIHGALHQPEAEQPHVEVEVLLRVTRDRGDVMDAEDARHDQYSANASSG